MANVANISTVLSLESASFLTGIEKSRGAVRSLINSLDPAAASAARFNRDMETLSRGLKSGQISADQFALASQRLEQRFATTATAGRQVTASTGQMQSGFKQLGFQLNDISGGFISGIPPMQIFAQQGSQVVQAIQMMNNSTSGFLGFLAGPWGAVLTSATVLLVGLTAAYFDGSEAAKAKEDAAKKLTSSIDSLNQSTERQISSEGRLRNASLASAEAMLKEAAAQRSVIQARIQDQKGQLNLSLAGQGLVNQFGGNSLSGAIIGLGAAGAAASARSSIKALNDQLKDLKQTEADAANAIKNIRIVGLQAEGNAARDKGVAATDRYKASLDRLNDSLKSGRITEQAYRDQYIKLSDAYDAASKSADRHSGSKAKTTDASRASARAAREEEKALRDVAKAAEQAAMEQRQFIDRLLPDQTRKRQLEADAARIGRLLAEGVVSPEAWQEATVRINQEYRKLVDSIDTSAGAELLTKPLSQLMKETSDDLEKRTSKIIAANDNLKLSFIDTAQSITGSLQGLASSIQGGGFLDILSGALNVLSQVNGLFNGGRGLFGSSQTPGANGVSGLNTSGFIPRRAAGGPVSGGRPYLVGENGPELFLPSRAGSVIPNHAMGGGGGMQVTVTPSKYFDVAVRSGAADVVRATAPSTAAAGANGALASEMRRRDRALA